MMAAEKMREIKICIPEELFDIFLPKKTLTHIHNARREALLALRSLIDARLESIDRKTMKTASKREKIKVE